MTHPLTPREKVARIVDPAAFLFTTDELMKGDTSEYDALRKADAIITALASGSGGHAELVRLAEASKAAWPDGKWFRDYELQYGERGQIDGPDAAFIAAANPATVLALLAENAALRGANYIQSQDMIISDARATEAERKLAEAVEAMEEIAAIEPKPFEGGLDMEAIRACEECRRYEGHPVQHGICNTHRRPIWDREKHEGHEEKALGYRAKSIARTFLSKEAERG